MGSKAAWALTCALLISLIPGSQRHAAAVAAPSVSVFPSQLSPNGDRDRETIVITVTLSQPARERVRIVSAQGKVVGYIHGYWKRARGTYKYVFNGTVKNTSGRLVTLAEGTYRAQATTKGADGSTATRGARFYVNNTLRRVSVTPTRLAYNTYNTLFSPNGDGRKDALVARFYLRRPATVSLRLYLYGRLAHRVRRPFSTAGPKAIVWPGKVRNSRGAWVWAPAGNYTVRLQALPADRAVAVRLGYALSSRQLFADKSRPAVSAGLSRSVIDTTARQSTRFSYRVRESGYRYLTIARSTGRVVYRSNWAATSTSGAYTWSGRDSSGSLVAPGRYTIRLYAQDRAANGASPYPAARSVRVVRSGPITGRAAKTPWSGYWWPMLNTYKTKLYNKPGPVARYDAYSKATGRKVGAYSWEYQNHRTTDRANDWWGHCQSWAAAAIMERQPFGRTVKGVSFSSDDAEGLYAETWTIHTALFYGTRYNGEGKNSAAYNDVYPADFDRLVQYWIGKQRTPLMMDFTTGVAVWNYPVYAFRRTSTYSGDKEYVTMRLTRAAPYLGVKGVTPMYQTFYYTLRDGTHGGWSNPRGSSLNTHPDYIVKVLGRAEDYGNPYVKPSVLNAMFR